MVTLKNTILVLNVFFDSLSAQAILNSMLLILLQLIATNIVASEVYFVVDTPEGLSDQHFSSLSAACAAGIAEKEKKVLEQHPGEYEWRGAEHTGPFFWGNSTKDPSEWDAMNGEIYCGHEYRKLPNGSWSTFWPYSGSHVSARKGTCPAGTHWNRKTGGCESNEQNITKIGPQQCEDGNPIGIENGNKYQIEVDYKNFKGTPLTFTRSFNSLAEQHWTWDFSQKIAHKSQTQCDVNNICATNYFLDVTRPNGEVIRFNQYGTFATSHDNTASIVYIDSRLTSTWTLKFNETTKQYELNDGAILETYDITGKLLSIKNIETGYQQTITGTDTNLQIQDTYGDSFQLILADGKITKLIDSDNNETSYLYTGDLLSSVVYPGNAVRIYHYEDPGLPSLLTGITDEAGRRYATWTYDNQKRGKSSEHGEGFEKVQFTFNADHSTTVINPFNKSTTYQFENYSGRAQIKNIAGAASENCVAANKSYTYDLNGFQDQVTDWQGNITDYDYDQKGRIIRKVEGFNTPQARTTETDWLPNINLKQAVREPGLTTTYTYYPNNRLQSVTQTDTTNHTTPLGNTQGRQKVWTYSYTYHTVAGVAADLLVDTQTIDGPLPGNADVTLRQYDTAGNLIKATNALGHVTTFGNFNGRGQAQTVTDANGIVTQLSYHPRGWLTKVTVKSPDGNALNDHITQYDYYPNGTLQRVTQADGSYLAYDYNDARHLTAISNNLGESITYTLNAEGQWTLAQTKDSSGVIKRQQQRAFDELGRLMDRFGQHNQHTQYNYDKNDNLALVSEQGQTTTPQTSQTYDALNRLKTLVDPDLNTVTYDYDGQGNLSSVTDQRGLQTQYLYDGFQQRIKQTSPDTGVTYFWYDEAGNLSQKQDARGVTTTYTYDLLNRLSGENYPATPGENTTYTYDQTAQGEQGIGRLTHIADPSGSTHYHYNHLGQIVKVDTQVMGAGYLTQYHYQATGQATGITYPSGLHISYQRDALGRIQQIDADESGQLTALASNIQYYPFGPSSQITYGNGLVQTSTYDSDYRLNQSQLSAGLTSFQNLGLFYDWFNNLIGLNDADGLQRQQSFSYDLQHRLDTATDNLPLPQGGYGSQDFAYDPVSNRTLLTTGSDQTTYNYPLDSNRLESSSLWNYEYDAAGNTTRRYDANGNQLVLTYNPRNRLSQVSHTDAGQTHTVTYEYNGLGQRVVKQSNSQTTYYLYDLGGQLLVEADTQGATQKEYVYFENKPLAILDAGETGNTAGFTLMLSPNPDRSAATALAASELSGNAYIFLTPDTNISQVRFYLDSTDATGTPLQTENNTPYDLQGGSASAANPFDTTALSDGTHTLFASITLADNSIVTVQVNFSVNNASSTPALSLSQSSTSFSLQEGAAAQSQTITLTTNNATTPAFTVSENATWLSVQTLSPTAPSDLQLTVDPSAVNLAPGTYSETLTATASGYTSAQHTVTLTVTSAGAYTLMLSPNPDRSAATALAASELSGNAYIFLTPDTNISQVRFYLDSTDATGTPLQTENNAPYDLQGGSASAANPFDTTALSDGTHTLFASITLADNSIVTVPANFSVNNASSTPALSLSQSSTSFSLQEGGAAQSQTITLTTNNATNPAFTVSENAPWLSVQALSPTAPSDIQLTVDPSAVNLAPGTYSETLTATASGYTSAQHTVTLTVTSAGAYTLMLSPNPDRSAATALAASELSGNAYIFLTPETNISQVRFYLDSTDATGTPLQTENNAPYDLQGGSASAANPFDTTALSDGTHTLFASITLADNSIVTVQVNFTVNNGLALNTLNSPIYHHLAPKETPPDKPLLTAHRVARLNRTTQPSTASL